MDTDRRGARERVSAEVFSSEMVVELRLILKLTRGACWRNGLLQRTRTMLFNIRRCRDAEILEELNGPEMHAAGSKNLPVPYTLGGGDHQFFGGPIPISGAVGDHARRPRCSRARPQAMRGSQEYIWDARLLFTDDEYREKAGLF